MSLPTRRVLYVGPAENGTFGDALEATGGSVTVDCVGTLAEAVDRAKGTPYDAVVYRPANPGGRPASLSAVREAAPNATTVLLTDDDTVDADGTRDVSGVDVLCSVIAAESGVTSLLDRLERRRADWSGDGSADGGDADGTATREENATGDAAPADDAAPVADVAAARRSGRDRSAAILETVPLAVAVIDADGEFEYCNDAARRILGLEDVEGTPTYQDLPLTVIDADGEPLDPEERPHRRVLRTGKPLQTEFEVRFDDGERRWHSVSGAALADEAGKAGEAVFAIEDVTDRKRGERELERANAMLEAVDDGVYALDAEGRFVAMNRAFARMVGDDREALLGAPASTVTGGRLAADVDAIEAKQTGPDGDVVTYETTVEGSDGDPLPVEVGVAPFPTSNGSTGRVGVVRDVSARERREEQLRKLHAFAQRLTGLETVREVCDAAVETAHETLGLPITTVERYDERAGGLHTVAATPEAADLLGDDPVFAPEDDVAWAVYTEGEARVLDDLETEQVRSTTTPLRSAMVLPVGSFGVLISGATTPDAFGDHEVAVAEVLAATVEAALDRVDREATLRERTEALETRTETLERVNRINTVIRDTTRALTRASTREEIERTVCTQLANAEPYRFAWIGDRDRVGGELVPRASAGVERGYLDAIAAVDGDAEAGNGPASRALGTRELAVQNNLHSDPPFEPWRTAALQRGYRAVVAVPLGYRETQYGVLSLYANSPGVFDDLEVAVLRELGDTIGYAINSVERRKALVSDSAVELEFRIDDPDMPAVAFATAEDASVEFEALVEQSDGTVRAFFTVSGRSPDVVDEHVERSNPFVDATLVSERDGGYFYEARVSRGSFLTRLFEAGAQPTSLVATPGGATLTVEFPSNGDVQALLEMVFDRFDRVELLARRELDRPVQTEAEFEAFYRDRLTERQEEVARTAYYAGFFNFPRDSTGSDVAEMLGVSQPTVNRHIREAERKLFELVFEGDDARSTRR